MIKKCFVLMLLLAFCAAAYAGEELTVRADLWMPYNGDPDSDKPGYAIEIIRAICEPQSISVKYQTMAWNRAIEEAKAGKYDCLVGASKEDATGFIFPAEKMGVMTTEFFVKAGNEKKVADIDSLKGLKIGIIADYAYNAELDKYIAENKADDTKIFVSTGEKALNRLIDMVEAGRIDGFIENPLVIANNERKAAVVSAGQIGSSLDLYFAFSPILPSSQKYADLYDKGIKELRTSGKLKEILNKYSVADWVP